MREKSSKEWMAPLTGLAFLALLIAGFAIGGEPPEAKDPIADILDYYTDGDKAMFGGLLVGAAAVLLVYFAGYLRKVLSDAEGVGGVLSSIAFGGSLIIAAGLAVDGTILIALSEAAEDIDPVAVQALQALWDNDWLPLAVGVQLFIFSSGLSIVRHGALPKWLGWIAIVLGVIAFTPIGFVAAAGTAIWVAIASVMLTMKARAA